MARQLGMHCQRGQLDAVETMYVSDGIDIAEGLAVKQTAADTVAVVSAAGDKVYGIAGGKRSQVGVAVVRQGKIWMAADDAAVPTLTGAAYVTAAGKVTHDAGTEASPNTLIGYFTSTEVAANGIQNVPAYNDKVKCAQVFVQL